MMGINLFGTCTMKYNPRLGEEIVARPEIAQIHPHQHDDTLQGVLEIDLRARPDPARAVGHGPVRLPGRAAAPMPPTRMPA